MNKNRNKDHRRFALYACALVAAFALLANVRLGTTPTEPQTTSEPSVAQVDANLNASAPTEAYNWEEDESLTQYVALPTAAATTESESATEAPASAQSDEEPPAVVYDDAVTNEELILSWPISGSTVLEYSSDRTVFDPTLELYRTNDSIWISAAEGDPVMAAADGTVDFIGESAESGLTLSVSHNDGWRTTYAQLKDVTVTEGERVSKGEILGHIAKTTKYGAATGDHLEFWVFLDGMSVDPDAVVE